jgi:hypothetical protein
MRFALLLGVVACLGSGCATLVRGSTESVTVVADRDSAFVFVDGIAAGVTPARLQVRRSSGHRVRVVRDSFRIAHAEVSRSFNPAAAVGSVLFGGVPSLAVDAGTGAVFDLDPNVVRVALQPDTAGVDAAAVTELTAEARLAARDGFAEADPSRRPSAPWLTVQVGNGLYVGEDPLTDRDDATGGLGASLLIGARTEDVSARLSATASSGVLFDNSERWEVAALLGVITEAAGGRLRLGFAAGPGLAGGRDSNACFLFCDGSGGERAALPTRVGLSLLGEAFVFPVPQVGLGLQVPANFRFDDSLYGVLLGVRFEAL